MDPQPVLDGVLSVCSQTGEAEPFEDALALLPALYELRPDAARAYSRRMRDLAADAVASKTMYPSEAERVVGVVEESLRRDAKVDFDAYMLFMEWNRAPERRFWQPRRRVLMAAALDLQDLADGKLDFLSISMPPRTGKSTMCIFFLTWVMGRNPERANVMSGHSDKLTKGFHQEALSFIGDKRTYRFSEVFPDAKMADKSMQDETISLGAKRRFPTLTCRSIEGTLTGAVEVGKDALLYMDDLVEDREEALNGARMDKLYSAYLNQLKDRMNDGARQLFVATRWVPNDPIGRIEEQYEDNPRYRFTVLPALGEDGKSNFVYDFGLGFSTEYYEDMRESLVSAGEEDSWAAKYMGRPFWIGGLMFPRDELTFYDDLPEGEPDAVIAVCDTKDRGVDYCVMPVGYVYGDKHYIHDVLCDNSLPEVVEPRLAEKLASNNVGLVRFESNSAGGRVADSVGEKCKALGHAVTIRKKFSTENKETRILGDSAWVKQNCLFRSGLVSGDYERFLTQLTRYTTEGRNKHDDAPDAMSMYKRFADSLRKARIEPVRRIL